MITINHINELRRLLVSESNYLVSAAQAILVDFAHAEEEWKEACAGIFFDELIGGCVYVLEETDDPASVTVLGAPFNLINPDIDPGFEPEYVTDHGTVLSSFFAIHNGGGPVFVVDKKWIQEPPT
jgi:hypothetical protein